MPSITAAQVGHLRVIKKLNPGARGAIQLAGQFGEALVCVRHRIDPEARIRYTSVELLVSQAAIRPKEEKLVAIRIDWKEQSLRQVAKAAGAKWDDAAKVWRMPKRLVGILRLSDRIVSG